MKKIIVCLLLICTFGIIPLFLSNVVESDADVVDNKARLTVPVALPSMFNDPGGNPMVPAFRCEIVVVSDKSSDVPNEVSVDFYNKSTGDLIKSFNIKSSTATTEQNVVFPFLKVSDQSALNYNLNLYTTSIATDIHTVTSFYCMKNSFPKMAGSITVNLPCYEVFINYVDTNGSPDAVIFRMYALAGAYPVGIDNYELFSAEVLQFDDMLSVIDTSRYYQQGYDKGYTDGTSNGETIGYNKGFEEAKKTYEKVGDLSFFGLITALVDVPVNAFTGLFNFEILGVNLFHFMTALLTLSFVITMFRIVWK